METTEKIVEAYVRYVKECFTIPNIRCEGQYEIDLLAVRMDDDGSVHRFHIETGVSISHFAKLTVKPYGREDLKIRAKIAQQRRTLGYFVERKFGAQEIIDRLKDYGFMPGNYSRIIVTWGWEKDVPEAAEAAGVELWDFRDILRDIEEHCREKSSYFTDDTLRTLQLMAKATDK
jgi:hypothetical protein